MKYERKRVFELDGVRYGLLSEIAPIFGREQSLAVVVLRDTDAVVPHCLPACVEVAGGDEGPYVIVRSNDTVGHPYGRQTEPGHIDVLLAVADRAALEVLARLHVERGLSAIGGTMDVVTLERACINCGRSSHYIVHDGDGVGLCASARLPGYEPRGCAKWRATDDLGRPVVRYVRAWRNNHAVARELGPWSFVAPDGRALPEEPPCDVQQEAIRLRIEEA